MGHYPYNRTLPLIYALLSLNIFLHVSAFSEQNSTNVDKFSDYFSEQNSTNVDKFSDYVSAFSEQNSTNVDKFSDYVSDFSEQSSTNVNKFSDYFSEQNSTNVDKLSDYVSAFSEQNSTNVDKLSDYVSALSEQNSTHVIKFSDFDLLKCKCKGNEILNESFDCVEHTDNSIGYVSFDPYYEEYKVNLSDLNSVRIEASYSEICEQKGQIAINIADVYLAQLDDNSEIKLWHGETGGWYRDFCVEHVHISNTTIWQAAVCMEQVTVNISSCCPDQHVFTNDLKCIFNQDAKLSPSLYMGETLMEEVLISPSVQRYPKCDMISFPLYPLSYAVLKYNEPSVILDTMHDVLTDDHFCIAITEAEESEELIYTAYGWHSDSWTKCENMSMTTSRSKGRCEMIMYWIDLPLLLLSTLLLSVIIMIYILLPELRKSLARRMIFCHIVSLWVGFITLIVLHVPQDANCKVYGPVVQLSFLSSFFWLNVMCFDMWMKLRCLRPHGQSERSARRRFIVYSIYGWGTPILITAITVLMDNIPQLLENSDGYIVPGWGVRNCWFVDSKAALLYYFGPIACIMTANLLSFIWVFFTVVKANIKHGKILKESTPPAHRSVWIYLKIFFMMGVSWIFEYISWQEGTCEYWIVTDIINALRGVILFVILFGSRKTLTKVTERLTVLNDRMHIRLTRSVNTIRRLSIVSNLSQTVETRMSEVRRTSEINLENGNRLTVPKSKREKSVETNKISSV